MMSHVEILKGSVGRNFIPAEYLPKGKNEYYLRNRQFEKTGRTWRHLTHREIEQLVKNGNRSDDWDDIWVTDQFDPDLILNSEFFGQIRIGHLKSVILQHHDLQIPTGIVHSKIIACDIGDNVAIHDVHYLAHYIIGDLCMLLNIDEMHTTNHAKFGNGIVKAGEPEAVRIWLDVMNETGCRKIAPFDGMIPADAYLWAKYRDDRALQERLLAMTQDRYDAHRGYYGTVGNQTVIKNSRILKDLKIGECAYIKGVNKLKNLTIHSSDEERTQIGEGVELVNGIIGYGCHVFYGVKAVRFILGNHANLKYGARLINSFLGANSTISCCEVLNNLIFPAHEQHHNNSFLIASVVLGQSNMAAGATIGSNHNSRANDNEVQAGRGFWPGLCTSIKHSSRFASFILLAKGDYPAELNIPLPFSLINNNTSKDCLEILPAFWWLYNMYALARNSWKFKSRDTRVMKMQNIEFDALAPDTIEEIFHARSLLELWTGHAILASTGERPSEKFAIEAGKKALNGKGTELSQLEILGIGIEKSKRKVLIIKAREAYLAYAQMILYYSIQPLMQWMEENSRIPIHELNRLKGPRETSWANLGGQLMPEKWVTRLRTDIGQGKLKSWDAVHKKYDALWAKYPLEKQKHAFASLCTLMDIQMLDKPSWLKALNWASEVQEFICENVFKSRQKDYENPFRQATFRNREEMIAAIGRVDDNSFITQIREETQSFKKRINALKKRN
jgi:hypothetical protein